MEGRTLLDVSITYDIALIKTIFINQVDQWD